ncbi:tripartite tricarboxylate transporter permease [Acrocarpospora macrocephala]|uniref:DUF112 domain-containing protein n=1 Tax=Acrocarpospora macrocephala TaxID=150177 RepID=A0A5M3WJP2_9ACTN|nr:tripartite tricarboxylate transporter permease [Acrocarpospora macrocephala]GES09397.1 hypothetical protein Amac_029930 [Acrocarpospora macrocephala]
MSNLLHGFSDVLTWANLGYLAIGVMVGMMIGLIPGLGSIAGMVLLFPLAFTLDPLPAIAMLAAVYYGAMYGGSVSAILINMPGHDNAVASSFDGYPMAARGRAGQALVIHAVTSFLGGTLGLVLLCLLAPIGSRLAGSLGPPEFFMLVILALALMTGIVGDDKIKGLLSALFGFAIATVGIDLVTGQSRFTFGNPLLLGGIDMVPVTVGLFAIGEVLYSIYTGQHRKGPEAAAALPKLTFRPSREEVESSRFATLRGTLIGFALGAMPGAGATVASLSAYSIEKSVSKRPERFGKGAVEGLAAPEAAHNAATSGAMMPLLSLGIPGSAATAVLLSAFLVVGLQPGPLLMRENPEFAWGVIASMYLGNVVLLIICIAGIPLLARVVRVHFKYIGPIVVVIATVGAYLSHTSVADVLIMYVFGVIGFFMRVNGYSPALTVIAMVLGPLAESAIRQSLLISSGSLLIFVERPFSLIVVIVVLAILVLQLIMPALRRRRHRTSDDGPAGPAEQPIVMSAN